MVRPFFPLQPIKPYADLSKIIPLIPPPTPTPAPLPQPTYIPYPVPTPYPTTTYRPSPAQVVTPQVQQTAINPTLLILGGAAIVALFLLFMKK